MPTTCSYICLSIKQSRRGKALAEAPNRRLTVFPMIRRPYTDFLTRPSACLPTYLLVYLPAYLPTYLPARLPAHLPVSVWFNSGEGSARSKAD